MESNRENSNIAIALDRLLKFISHFGLTRIIFDDCMLRIACWSICKVKEMTNESVAFPLYTEHIKSES